jgi:hypothetical protein
LHAWIDLILTWAEQHDTLLTALTISSVSVFVATLIVIPWLILRIPADYFSNPSSDRFSPLGNHPVAILVVDIFRNTIGTLLFVLGIILLVLPGQGLLTIIMGIVITRFPGKRRFVYWVANRKSVHQSLNWIRQKGGKKPIAMKPPEEP